MARALNSNQQAAATRQPSGIHALSSTILLLIAKAETENKIKIIKNKKIELRKNKSWNS